MFQIIYINVVVTTCIQCQNSIVYRWLNFQVTQTEEYSMLPSQKMFGNILSANTQLCTSTRFLVNGLEVRFHSLGRTDTHLHAEKFRGLPWNTKCQLLFFFFHRNVLSTEKVLIIKLRKTDQGLHVYTHTHTHTGQRERERERDCLHASLPVHL